MFNIAVYCTSRYSAYNEFSQYMDGCIKKYLPVGKPSAIITGDYKTTNSGNGLVAKYAFEHNIPLRRFSTLWGKHIPTKSGKKNNAGVASNAQIVKNANGCILFWTPTSVAKWDFMSGGCRSFLKMCDSAHLARPLIKIQVDIYKPDIEPKIEEPIQDVGTDGATAAGGIGGLDAGTGIFGGAAGGSSHHGGMAGGAVGGSMPTAPQIGGGVNDTPSGADGDISADNGDVTSDATGTDDAESDNIGDIDADGAAPNTAGSLISNISLDTNGDGAPDTEVNAIDTDMNGTPDAVITPVDSDNNGTIDSLELSPMPTVGQIVAQNGTTQQTVPSTAPNVQPQQPTPPTTANNAPNEEEKKQQ